MLPDAAGGETDYQAVVREFIGSYPQRGLLIVISDFLDDKNCERALQYLADFGHELMLLQIWDDEDRTPPWTGELELQDAETGAGLKLDSSGSIGFTHIPVNSGIASIRRIRWSISQRVPPNVQLRTGPARSWNARSA